MGCLPDLMANVPVNSGLSARQGELECHSHRFEINRETIISYCKQILVKAVRK
jgi:hypothetical protein